VSRVLAPTEITSLDEEPAYFPAGDETLFGLLTRPPAGPLDSALLMVPSAERLGYRNRVGVMLAHRLAARGHQALRFNYRGCGESTGMAGRFRLDDLFTEDAVGAAAWLRERGVDTVRLVGDCTNICVLYTAADARNLGYAVEVLEAGVTSFDEEAHRDALRELEKTLGAKILR